jgi:hypothetical protein
MGFSESAFSESSMRDIPYGGFFYIGGPSDFNLSKLEVMAMEKTLKFILLCSQQKIFVLWG